MPTEQNPAFDTGNPKPTKDQLRAGIWRWVKARVEGAVHFTYLHQLSYEDMMLLARAMGYVGPGDEPVPERVFERVFEIPDKNAETSDL